ncbi:hypothetical protein MTR_0075s0030 [Medicago truncatula]|uniref:Uncharacterized protein n=1 Tax=Medicago truncatula TaxID=3880 RepID=A0A072TJ41_MEDTR|nr:hypothetical protein MTR_0075s0030 [Medicago truncatula]
MVKAFIRTEALTAIEQLVLQDMSPLRCFMHITQNCTARLASTSARYGEFTKPLTRHGEFKANSRRVKNRPSNPSIRPSSRLPSQTSGILPSQPKANPKGQPNDVTLRDGKKLEDPVVETKTNEVEVESEKPQSEKVVIESENPNVSPQYEPKIPLPQGFDEFKLDEQVRKFIEIIQANLPSRLKDPKSFSIPCVIGSEIIERVMCDLGENISLMPLSLCERLGIGRETFLNVKLMTIKERFMGDNPRI